MQVHAVSCKASDVRPVVMELNAKRQALDEAEEQPVQPEAASHEPAAQLEEDDVAWQEYNEVKHGCHYHWLSSFMKVDGL